MMIAEAFQQEMTCNARTKRFARLVSFMDVKLSLRTLNAVVTPQNS